MEAAIWHDVECGSYTADLELWEELSGEGAAVLDLGCGTGRVALHLARRGRRVTGLDRDPQLLAALELRAGLEELHVDTRVRRRARLRPRRGVRRGVRADAAPAAARRRGRTARAAVLRGAASAAGWNLRDHADGPRRRAPRRASTAPLPRTRARSTAGCTRACPRPHTSWTGAAHCGSSGAARRFHHRARSRRASTRCASSSSRRTCSSPKPSPVG